VICFLQIRVAISGTTRIVTPARGFGTTCVPVARGPMSKLRDFLSESVFSVGPISIVREM
jgi:hypothetical protein